MGAPTNGLNDGLATGSKITQHLVECGSPLQNRLGCHRCTCVRMSVRVRVRVRVHVRALV